MSVAPVILCSGFGLGFYIPGLLIKESLRKLGTLSDIEVFDCLLPDSARRMVDQKARAYRDDFRVAIAAQKIPGDIRTSWDVDAVVALLNKWHQEDRRHFICLSGHWIHVLNIYRALKPSTPIDVDLLYLDAKPAPSWKQVKKIDPLYEEIFNVVRFYDTGKDRIVFSLDANIGKPVPYRQRNGHLVLHGGGMGIGTYRERIPTLEQEGFELDIAFHASSSEPYPHHASRTYYQDDPAWRAWHRDSSGDYTFPAFGQMFSDRPTLFHRQSGCNGLHKVIRQSSAIVSKPGAGTLIDSLASATPVILLEPFGPHEEENARLWTSCGFGIGYGDWQKTHFSREVLHSMHEKLCKVRETAPDYALTYVNSRASPTSAPPTSSS